MTITWHLGTMGFSYKDWSGVFYPEGMAARDYLAHYSQHFSAVELDSTFYGTPKPTYVERWAAVTPADFIFCAKVPRTVTHDLRLVEAQESMAEFVRVMTLLGDKLGAILIQLPPDMTFDHIHHLAVFLRQLPPGPRYAVEFRHPSWHATATGQLLQNHGVCWASTDYKHLPQRVYVTTDFVYVRWIGRHGQFETKDVERLDRTERLQAWVADLQARADEFESVYGFFNNDYAGHAPATLNRFKQIIGQPTRELKPPQQGRLF